MNRTITKLIFAVTLLFGLLNVTLAEKFKANMEFGGVATGSSKDADAEITKGESDLYTLSFNNFSVNITGFGDIDNAIAEINDLEFVANGNGFDLKPTSNSAILISTVALNLDNFAASVDENGVGSGSFSGSTLFAGFMTISANCDFTLTKVSDDINADTTVADTIVTKEILFENVAFYNKAVDLSKEGDTTTTNNNSTSAGLRLYQKKADFSMTDYELSVSVLKLNQSMVLNDLEYEYAENGKDIHVTGETKMAVNAYKINAPAKVDLIAREDGYIDGTIEIQADMVGMSYKIIVILGEQAKDVIIENKILEYEKTDSYKIKSDKEFVFDSLIYINKNGILIENIQYSIVDQPMTLLIKEYEKAAPVILDTILGDKILQYSPTMIHANKAEAYITVGTQTAYLKDVDIDLDITVLPSNSVFGSLTIVDGGSGVNKFIDPDGPVVLPMAGRNIIMYVDTTGNELDGYTKDSKFNISGVYDYADGKISTVSLADLDAAREAAIIEAKDENGHGFEIEVVATDQTGNSTTFSTTCYAKPAPVSIEEIAPKLFDLRIVADSLTGKAIVNLESAEIKYVAKNKELGLSKDLGTISAQVEYAGSFYELPREIEMPVGNEVLTYFWENPYTGESKNLSVNLKVYSNLSNMTSTANVASKTVSVIYKNGQLIVNGANDANVSIINLSGATVYRGKAGAINLHKGIYIVKVNGKAYKITVK